MPVSVPRHFSQGEARPIKGHVEEVRELHHEFVAAWLEFGREPPCRESATAVTAVDFTSVAQYPQRIVMRDLVPQYTRRLRWNGYGFSK